MYRLNIAIFLLTNLLVIRQIIWRFEAVSRSEQTAIGSTSGGGAEDSSDQALCEERIYLILSASPPFHLRLGVMGIVKNMVPILKGSMDLEKLQATLGDESLAKSSDLKKALEMVVLLEAQMKEMNPNLDSISDYQKKVSVYNEQVEELNVVTNERNETKKQYDEWRKKIVLVQDLGDKFRKLSEERASDNARFDSVETIKADPATKNQGVEPTTEHHEGVQITSIPPEVAPIIEENVDYQNDDKESSPLLDAYLKRDEAEQNATPSTYVDKVRH
ncbi:hypothetical protein Tco_1405176 [Tanacetum coccineum]